MGSYQRICEVCGANFVAKWPRRQRCSAKCWHQRSQRVASAPPLVKGARWVALTMNKFALVDESDFDDVNQWNWSAMRCNGGHWYAVRGGAEKTLMHRHIFRATSSEKVDHKDGNGLNNRRENIRSASNSQNGMNVKSQLGRASRFKGVWRPMRWNASIRIDYKTIQDRRRSCARLR